MSVNLTRRQVHGSTSQCDKHVKNFTVVLWGFSVADGAAMSLVESTAAFFQRCDEITSDGSLRVALDAQEIKNHSAMAFTMGTPQMPLRMSNSTCWLRECLGQTRQ
jgi:hypothetical protein